MNRIDDQTLNSLTQGWIRVSVKYTENALLDLRDSRDEVKSLKEQIEKLNVENFKLKRSLVIIKEENL